MHQAKTDLSKLVAAMEAGERVVIKRAGKPVARLMPMESHAAPDQMELGKKRLELLGCMKGQLYVADYFDAPLPDAFWLGES